jgi:hypothetical protein
LAGVLIDSIGGIIALKSRPVFASPLGLFCTSTSNAVTSFADVYPSQASNPSSFYFVNATHQESPISDVFSLSFSPADTVPLRQSMTAAEFAAGFNLTLSFGMTLSIQCDAPTLSTGTVTGCALNNRYETRMDKRVS